MSGTRRRDRGRAATPADQLLNFSYPIPLQEVDDIRPVDSHRRWLARHASPFSKKRHMRANFRLAVSAGSEPDSADDPVDWDRVMLVNQLVENRPMCPICLDVLVAPRITKCGHTTCLKCILHYFSLSQRNYARCVLCGESVYIRDLRCLTFDSYRKANLGDTATFVLLRRAGLSSVPVGPFVLTSPFQFQLIVVGLDIGPVLRQELDSLVASLTCAEPAEIIYYQMALESVKSLLESSSVAHPSSSPSHPEQIVADRSKENVFYQAADGQSLFLNSLSFRCLLFEHDGVDHLPSTFTAPIIDVSHIRQTDSTRSRYRFVSHLPLTTNFTLADVALRNLVHPRTMVRFRDEIQQQSKQRARLKAKQLRSDEKMKAINVERERQLLQRSRCAAGSFINPVNPFGFAAQEDFGPAIGQGAVPVIDQVGSWSAVADRGLMASSTWAPLPPRPKPAEEVEASNNAPIITPEVPLASAWSMNRTGRCPIVSSSTSGSMTVADDQRKLSNKSKQTMLWTNSGSRSYKH